MVVFAVISAYDSPTVGVEREVVVDWVLPGESAGRKLVDVDQVRRVPDALLL